MAVLSEEQVMLQEAAKNWTREVAPVTAFRALRESANHEGFDRALWRQMCEMGWAGILVPESYGGSGLDFLSIGLVLEETGRTLTASPLLSTALVATSALLLVGNDRQKDEWLAKFAAGEALGALAAKGHTFPPHLLSRTKFGQVLHRQRVDLPHDGLLDDVV